MQASHTRLTGMLRTSFSHKPEIFGDGAYEDAVEEPIEPDY